MYPETSAGLQVKVFVILVRLQLKLECVQKKLEIPPGDNHVEYEEGRQRKVLGHYGSGGRRC
jgi:hypothetical protein